MSACNPMRLRWSTVPVLPGNPDIPRLEDLECEDRGTHQVSQFMSQVPEALALACGLSIEGVLVLFASELGDGARNGFVQAPIQRAKVVRVDRLVDLTGELRDRLTDVAIVVHDL